MLPCRERHKCIRVKICASSDFVCTLMSMETDKTPNEHMAFGIDMRLRVPGYTIAVISHLKNPGDE